MYVGVGPPPPPGTAGRAAPAQTPLPARRPRRGRGGLGKWALVPSPPPAKQFSSRPVEWYACGAGGWDRNRDTEAASRPRSRSLCGHPFDVQSDGVRAGPSRSAFCICAQAVPGLFVPDDLDLILEGLRPSARDLGRDLTREAMVGFFTERCRSFLSLVLCMSPVGTALRNRLRKFPSLVNCCTIDWYAPWPGVALQSVASYFIEGLCIDDDKVAGVIQVLLVSSTGPQNGGRGAGGR